MSESKQTILSAIRQHRLDATEHPTADGEWITYADPRGQFMETLGGVGGRCVVVGNLKALHRELEALPEYQSAAKIASTVAGAGRPNVDLQTIDDPHEMEDVDFAILSGEFGVAENGAVWVTDRGLKHRVLPFIAQHLALVVPADAIVDNMHRAYARLREQAGESLFAEAGFGTFISGPSKTADIEQSLVIGAHGARSLTVFLL